MKFLEWNAELKRMKVSSLVSVAGFCASLGVALLLGSCSSLGRGGARNPASNLPPAFQDGLVAGAQDVLARVSAPDFDSTTCVSYLTNIESQIEQIQPDQAPQDEMIGHAKDLIQLLWSIRLELHKRLPEFNAPCVMEVRNTFRLLRFVEDLLAEKEVLAPDLDANTFDFSHENIPIKATDINYLTLTNPEFGTSFGPGPGQIHFQDGDILLARGPSFLSAMIARIGDVSSQFSHVVLVHVDHTTGQASGKTETIESYVGPGAGIYDIDYALKNENVRLLLLRPKDPAMGARAADFMYGKVRDAIASGNPIPYDYGFDFQDHSRLSCAEVAEWGYQDASDGQMILPFYPSVISTAPWFLNRINMKTGPTFTPGDLEVDPRFDEVLEWRDLRLTRDSRVKDAIITSMLDWIDHKNYRLKQTWTSRFAGDFVWPIRQTFLWPLVQKAFSIQDFAKDIPRNLFQTMVQLDQVGEVFLNHMKAEDTQFYSQTGWPMTYQNLYQALETYRAQDLQLYRNRSTRGKSEFSFAFRPKKKKGPRKRVD